MQTSNSLIAGITGGMGCGQTTLAKFLEEMGFKIIYADKIAHQIVNKDTEVRKQLRQAFGKNIYTRNGKLKRKLLAGIVFNDENRVHLLNKIVHPPMAAQIIEEIEKARESGKYPVIGVDAALIFEANLEKMFDVIVVVTSKMPYRISRIQQRDDIPQKEIMKRIRKQLPIEEKSRWADFVIRNDGTIDDLKKKAEALHKQLLNLAKRSRPFYSNVKPTVI